MGEGGADEDEDTRPLDMDEDEDAVLEAACAFDMRSRMEWMDWTTLSWITARHEAFSARNA